jgi:universal stress protein E
MDKPLRRILVAVDVERPPHSQLHKAAALARSAGASIELFYAITAPDPGAGYPETASAAAVRERRTAVADRARERLERLARGAALRGLKVTFTASWDYPIHEAIARRALAGRADLVIAAASERRHGPAVRLFLRNTDWELIRSCPVPLLFVKSPRAYNRPVIVAAVDPFHNHAKPADLDTRLIHAAQQFARLLHGNPQIFHAYMPLLIAGAVGTTEVPVVLSADAQAAHDEHVARVVGKLAERERIPKAARHVVMGEVGAELSALARRARVGLVVMGAVSRSGLARVFVGNTAERVLDKLACDVLIVKPRGFVSKVARTPAVASIPARARAVAGAPQPRRRRGAPPPVSRLPPLF